MNHLNSLIPDLKTNHSLKPYTTFKIGGPAEFFVDCQTTDTLINAVKAARKTQTPFVILGNGSNILIADKGVKGLVIKNSTSQIKVLNKVKYISFKPPNIPARFHSLDNHTLLEDYGYDETKFARVLVSLASGVTLPKAIFSLINQGITGLEWFAGIPATVGGATYINLHGGQHYWSDYLVSADILTVENKIANVPAGYFCFDYDQSTLKTAKDIVLTVTLRLFKGPKDKALNIAKTWALKKSHQPQRSAGCIFQNLSPQQQQQLNFPTPSIGYLMDKKLKLKGTTVGQARIALKHAGFIENLGQASSQDVFALIKLMKTKAKTVLGLDLKLEIVPLGFDKSI